MKKKALAIVLTAALVVAQAVSVFAAGSAGTGLVAGGGAARGSSGGGGGGGSTTTSQNTSSSQPTTASRTDDGQSFTQNGAGSQTSSVSAQFAVGVAETAGLPAAAVASINSINAGTNLVTSVGIASLEGYSALTETAAVVLNEVGTGVVANREVPVSLYVPNLAGNNLKILCYENATGLWKVIEPTAINYENGTISFNMFGSGTVTVIHN